MFRKLLAFSSLCLIVAACGNKSSLGSGGDNVDGKGGTAGVSGSGGGHAWDPCAGKPCGAECSQCSPNDPDCAETAVLKFCSEDGICGAPYPACSNEKQCSDVSDCPALGAPCEVCPDGSYACSSVDCIGGQCVFTSDSCQGQQCSSDSDCPQMGAPCQLCPDGSAACPWTGCVDGQCVGAFPGCPGWDPCAGKSCGEACTQCPPNDPTCVETAVLKVCDSNGMCGGGAPDCGSGQCSSALDCPVIAVCMPCPDGTCAQPECMNGKCDLVCPPPPNPQCKVSSDCPQIEICKQCKDGSCASIECVNGMCDFVCGI